MEESENSIIKKKPRFDDEIDLAEIFTALKIGKRLIFITTIALAFTGLAFSLLLTDYYRSEAILIERDDEGASSLSGYSQLASLSGLNISSNNSNSVLEAIELIKSREFVKHLISFEGIMPSLMAASSFNKSTQTLNFDPEIYNLSQNNWIRKESKTQTGQPSYLEVHKKYINDVLSINQDDKTGLVYMSVTHISPVFAKEFLSLIIQEANSYKRDRDIDTSKKAINYLEQELSKTPLKEIKNSISQLIESQLEVLMMANAYNHYTLVPIEPPFIPDEKSEPFRSLIVIAFTITGLLASSFFVLFSYYFNQANRP